MEKTFLLKIVEPEKIVCERQVDMAIFPGLEGDVGILPEHSSFISALRPGSIVLYQDKVVQDRFFVSGGYVEVKDNHCTVLADAIFSAEDLKEDEIRTEMDRLRQEGREDLLAIEEEKLNFLKNTSIYQ